VFLLALSTGHKVGLGVSGAVFILFALTSSVLLPRYRPQFPSGALWAFIVVALALFGGMLAAVVVFGAEPKVARNSAHAPAQPTAPAPQPGATTVQVSEKEFKITLASTTLEAGQITFDVKNAGTVPHDLVIAGTSDRTKLIAPGQTATLTAQLKPGRYELYCSVAGHKQAGMDEKIQVS
jgi:plastocyanin